jgi:TPP-dependent pyruvate/acetoin dehydrogenase alpha subunit
MSNTGTEASAGALTAGELVELYHRMRRIRLFQERVSELFGRQTGVCAGRGGSMHIADPAIGMLGANGIVGPGLPISVGAAFAAQLRRSEAVTVAFFGDGAVTTGAFHEALNLAAVWKLPIVFFLRERRLCGVLGHSQPASGFCGRSGVGLRDRGPENRWCRRRRRRNCDG